MDVMKIAQEVMNARLRAEHYRTIRKGADAAVWERIQKRHERAIVRAAERVIAGGVA